MTVNRLMRTTAVALTLSLPAHSSGAAELEGWWRFAEPDGDGMPNGWEIRCGLDPHDPSDAGLDADGDGMTNLREFRLGRNPRVGAQSARLIRSAVAAPQ